MEDNILQQENLDQRKVEVDCPWSEWSECPIPCGKGGKRSRTKCEGVVEEERCECYQKRQIHPDHPFVEIILNDNDTLWEMRSDIIESLMKDLVEHGFVLFRNQTLSSDDHRKFGRQFNRVITWSVFKNTDLEVLYWHNDWYPNHVELYQKGYYLAPIGSWYMHQVPTINPTSGPTLWVNTRHFYKNLPKNIQMELDQVPDLVIQHYISGDQILFLHGDKSITKISKIFNEKCYAHVWKRGDIILGDNTQLAHSGTHCDPKEDGERILWRTKSQVSLDEAKVLFNKKIILSL